MAQALRFYGSVGVTVTGITIQNSPQCHLKFDNCAGVQVFNMSISSPGNSINTDGIHLQNSRDVSIHHTDLSCGNSPSPSERERWVRSSSAESRTREAHMRTLWMQETTACPYKRGART